MYATIAARMVAAIGKRTLAEAILSNICTRLVEDPRPLPTSWATIARYQDEAQSWAPRHLEEKRLRENPPLPAVVRPTALARQPEQLALPLKWRFAVLDTRPVVSTAGTESSASNPPNRAESRQIQQTDTQTRHTGRAFSSDPVPQYPPAQPTTSRVPSTPPAVSDDCETIAWPQENPINRDWLARLQRMQAHAAHRKEK
jgi:hypothetical protein